MPSAVVRQITHQHDAKGFKNRDEMTNPDAEEKKKKTIAAARRMISERGRDQKNKKENRRSPTCGMLHMVMVAIDYYHPGLYKIYAGEAPLL